METVADIIREMRGYSHGMPASYHVTMSWRDFRVLLDRLEAAHKRESAKAKAALAAPPRNCDKVKTSWDVLKEWHEGLDTANDIVRMLDWLLAPATEKEGGAK